MTRASPVVVPPQAAALAAGAAVARPVVRDGAVVVRRVVSLTLASDQRILHGLDAGRFLARVCELLEEPSELAGD